MVPPLFVGRRQQRAPGATTSTPDNGGDRLSLARDAVFAGSSRGDFGEPGLSPRSTGDSLGARISPTRPSQRSAAIIARTDAAVKRRWRAPRLDREPTRKHDASGVHTPSSYGSDPAQDILAQPLELVQRISRSLPGGEPAQKGRDISEAQTVQLKRRTGARLLGPSSAIEDDLGISGQLAISYLDLVLGQ